MKESNPLEDLFNVRKEENTLVKRLKEIRETKAILWSKCLDFLGIIPDGVLRKREMELIQILHNNPHFSNKDLAISMNISERTVKFHLSSIFNRLGISSRTELKALYRGQEGEK